MVSISANAFSVRRSELFTSQALGRLDVDSPFSQVPSPAQMCFTLSFNAKDTRFSDRGALLFEEAGIAKLLS